MVARLPCAAHRMHDNRRGPTGERVRGKAGQCVGQMALDTPLAGDILARGGPDRYGKAEFLNKEAGDPESGANRAMAHVGLLFRPEPVS